MNREPEIKKTQIQIQRSKVARAKWLTFEQRIREGADLFDEGMRWMRELIQSENPDFTEEQVQREVDRRKQIRRRIDDAGLYRPFETGLSE